MQYYTYWDELERPTWEQEEDLTQYGNLVVTYCAGEPLQLRGDNTKYRRYRVQVAKRAIARETGERHLPTGYMVCCDVRARPSLYSPDIVGSYIYFKTTHAGWQLARVVRLAEDTKRKSLPHTIRMLDLGKEYNVHLSKETLTTVSEERALGAGTCISDRPKNYTPSLE